MKVVLLLPSCMSRSFKTWITDICTLNRTNRHLVDKYSRQTIILLSTWYCPYIFYQLFKVPEIQNGGLLFKKQKCISRKSDWATNGPFKRAILIKLLYQSSKTGKSSFWFREIRNWISNPDSLLIKSIQSLCALVILKFVGRYLMAK